MNRKSTVEFWNLRHLIILKVFSSVELKKILHTIMESTYQPCPDENSGEIKSWEDVECDGNSHGHI